MTVCVKELVINLQTQTSECKKKRALDANGTFLLLK